MSGEAQETKEKQVIRRDSLGEILIDADALSILCSCSLTRISTLAKELQVPKSDGKHYDLARFIQSVIAFQRARMRSPAEKSNGKGKDRKTELESEKLQMQLDERRGELIPLEMVEREWGSMVTAAKQKLAAIPSKAAPDLAHETEALIIQDYLEKKINEALFELASPEAPGEGDLREEPSKAEEKDPIPLSTPSEANSEPMGGQTQEAVS